MNGKVTLVGAGSGDAGLITVKGLEALKNADVVVYDRLAGNDILKFINKNAEKINVGKESSKHMMRQEEINRILVNKAKEGKNVVRLKGGDCFLFGRGGEELEILALNNIDFEVIPGVSSALAVPSYGGIPLTHRNFSSSVQIMTGHRKENNDIDIDFENCVKSQGTLVFLMSVSNLKEITEGLLNAGMDANMPCAIIENGTLPIQRKIVSDIKNVYNLCIKKNIKSPSVFVVGKVCRFSEKFDWFSKLPLKGKKIIITRPENRIRELSERLRNLGAYAAEYPCIETVSAISNIDDVVNKIKKFDYVVFTSPSGVDIFFEKLLKKGYDARIFGGKKTAALGNATAERMKNYFINADIVPSKYDSRSLGILISEKAAGKRVILLRAENASKDLPEELANAKIYFEDYPIYKTNFIKKYSKETDNADFVIFTSVSTVRAFTENTKDYSQKAVCIGEKTEKEAKKYFRYTIRAKNASVDDIINSIISEVKNENDES